MSIYVTSAVWKAAPVKGSDLLVLLALADFANDDGICWPAMATIADKARISERSAQRACRAMHEAGLIEIDDSSGPKGANKYRVCLDAFVGQPASNSTEKGGDKLTPHGVEGGDTGDTGGVTNTTGGGDTGVTRTVIEPPIEPSRERGAHECVDGEETADDRRKLVQRVKRLEQGHDGNVWPGSVGSSTEWAVRQFAALSEDDRKLAEDRRDGYLAECRRQKCRPVAVGVYLRDRKFEGVAQEAKTGSGMPDDYAPPFGPVWSAWRMAALIEGGQAAGIAALDQRARFGKGFKFGPAIFALRDQMQPVTNGSEIWSAWQQLFDARGWPWIPPLGNQSVAYFPKVDGADPPAIDRAIMAFTAERNRAKAEFGGAGNGHGNGNGEKESAGSTKAKAGA